MNLFYNNENNNNNSNMNNNHNIVNNIMEKDINFQLMCKKLGPQGLLKNAQAVVEMADKYSKISEREQQTAAINTRQATENLTRRLGPEAAAQARKNAGLEETQPRKEPAVQPVIA